MDQITKLIMEQETLRSRTLKGTFWSAADAFLGQGVSFLVGIVLARLLSPDEYGLIGICLIFTTVLNGIVDSGFSSALIRKKEVSQTDYNTMFFTNLATSGVLYLFLFFCAPFVSHFFGRSELIPLVRAMGCVLFLNALSITQYTVLTKRLDFKTKTKASLASAVGSGVIGIVMAYMGLGVWSLVAQQLSKQLLYAVCLWVLNRWKPSRDFSKESFRYMWGFGSKMMLSGLLNNIWNELYKVVVGKFYSPATLGQYTRSSEYASIFSSNLTSIVQRVSYPALAEIQDDKERMVAAYRKVIKVTMFVTCICMFSLGAVAEPLIYCLIGPQWHEAATYLPLICLSMVLYPLHSINLNMLQIQGRSDIFLYLEIIKKVIGIIPLTIGALFNIYWMLIASLFTGVISFFLNSYYTGKKLGYSSWMQLRDVAPDFGIATAVALAVYFLKYLPISYWCILPMQVVIGILVLLLICEKAQMQEYIEIKNIILKNKQVEWKPFISGK